MVQTVTGNLRRQLLQKSVEGAEPISRPRVEIQVDPITLEEKRVPHPAYSFKRDLARSAWLDFLNQSILTAEGSYISLAEASVKDLQFAAETRLKQAASLHVEAEKYTALAEKML